jgi:hypothetical protein
MLPSPRQREDCRRIARLANPGSGRLVLQPSGSRETGAATCWLTGLAWFQSLCVAVIMRLARRYESAHRADLVGQPFQPAGGPAPPEVAGRRGVKQGAAVVMGGSPRARAVVADRPYPEIGPSGAQFVTWFRHRTGSEPSHVAAQAAAAWYLPHAAHRPEPDLLAERPTVFVAGLEVDAAVPAEHTRLVARGDQGVPGQDHVLARRSRKIEPAHPRPMTAMTNPGSAELGDLAAPTPEQVVMPPCVQQV